MDPSIPRPTGVQGAPSGSGPRRAATDSGPISGAAEEGPRGTRIGIARLPTWSRGGIGLLLLGLIVLPWLPPLGPPRHAKPTRRIPGVGDAPILAFALAPDGATIASIQWDGRVALRGTAGGVNGPSFLDHGGHEEHVGTIGTGLVLQKGHLAFGIVPQPETHEIARCHQANADRVGIVEDERPNDLVGRVG